MDFQAYFNEYMELFPSANDSLGLPEYKYLASKYENYIHPSHRSKQIVFYNKYLYIIDALPKLNHYHKVLRHRLVSALKALEYDFHLMPLEHMNNPIQCFCENLNGDLFFQFQTAQDYKDYLDKTLAFVIFINTCVENMKLGVQKGIILPKTLAELLHAQCEKILIMPCKHKNMEFREAANNILNTPINNLVYFLKNQYLPKCNSCSYGLYSLGTVGAKMYRCLLRQYTSTNLNVMQIHRYGLAEVHRIYIEMVRIKDKYGFKGSVQEFNAHLASKPELRFQNENEMLTLYRKQLSHIKTNILDKLFQDNISHDCIVSPVPHNNARWAAEAYYLPGSIDNKRKGKFYINSLRLEELSKMDIECLSLHEGLPGHHYQLTNMLDQDHPLFIKAESLNETEFEEGWALYCENLGSYKTIESYYGKLNMEMTRALRLVIDTGLHYYGWSIAECLDFMQIYQFESRAVLEARVHRYMAIPGQALAYKLGEKIFLTLRKKYVDSNIMDIREFHHKCLRYGSMPLKLLEASFQSSI